MIISFFALSGQEKDSLLWKIKTVTILALTVKKVHNTVFFIFFIQDNDCLLFKWCERKLLHKQKPYISTLVAQIFIFVYFL